MYGQQQQQYQQPGGESPYDGGYQGGGGSYASYYQGGGGGRRRRRNRTAQDFLPYGSIGGYGGPQYDTGYRPQQQQGYQQQGYQGQRYEQRGPGLGGKIISGGPQGYKPGLPPNPYQYNPPHSSVVPYGY